MSPVRKKALAERGVPVRWVVGKGVCRSCGGSQFGTALYSDGSYAIVCAGTNCHKVWAAPRTGPGSVGGGEKAVGGGGDVKADLVS